MDFRTMKFGAPRALRYLLVICISLGAILLFLLASASANTALFAQNYKMLVLLNGSVVGVLMLLVGVQLWRLRQQVRAGVFGSKLTVRLVWLFALMAVLPGALVYGVSVQFLGKSIESWFDVRIDQALEGGLNLGHNALEHLQTETADKAQQIALAIGDQDAVNSPSRLNQMREQTGVYEAALFNNRGALIVFAGGVRAGLRPEQPPAQALRKVRLQQTYSAVETQPDSGLTLRVVVPVNTRDPVDPLRILQIVQPVPKQIQQDAETVQTGYRDYQELSFSRQALKRLYALTLTLTLLLALLSALALAVFLSERFSTPLALLAEGTRAVAQGDFTRQHPVKSRDELGVLTQSFNTMTQQLAEAQRRAEENRRAIETANAYLESILRNLSAGVLAFDQAFRLQAANPSAAVILQQPMSDLLGQPLSAWAARLAALGPFAQLVQASFQQSPDGQWQRQAEIAVSANARVLLMRGTHLPGDPAEGYIVVFDDVSDLIHAQRDAAWAEVARRLAHEIKNPLTPIQLSAERLQHKLADKLGDHDADTLARGTQTIVTQVAAMKQMVDDFALYARQSQPGAMQPVDIQALLLEVLGLYENQRSFIHVVPAEKPALIQGEPTRLRQVMHNLLQNALDAMSDFPNAALEIACIVVEDQIRLSFEDNGAGFPDELIQSAFQPYVTTKPKGTGLGLAIVKKIMDEHQGRILIENRHPRGARVVLYFPVLLQKA
jgi:nitrogen fixation/metabolism regulation signal transduction histidine kinase